jgi:hypothetical protein
VLAHMTVLATSNPPATPYLVGIVVGFVVGVFGHINKSTLLIALGIAVIGLTTLLFIIATDPTLGSG